LQFGMHTGKKDQVEADFGYLRLLGLHEAVGEEEDDHVQRDESKGNVGPAPAAHVFVPQRNEQEDISLTRIGRWQIQGSSQLQNRVTWQGFRTGGVQLRPNSKSDETVRAVRRTVSSEQGTAEKIHQARRLTQ